MAPRHLDGDQAAQGVGSHHHRLAGHAHLGDGAGHQVGVNVGPEATGHLDGTAEAGQIRNKESRLLAQRVVGRPPVVAGGEQAVEQYRRRPPLRD